jgi:hypothetical protein
MEELGVIPGPCPYTKKYQWRLPKDGCANQGAQPTPNTNNLRNLRNQPKTNGKQQQLERPIGGCASSRVCDNLYENADGDGHRVGLPDIGGNGQ